MSVWFFFMFSISLLNFSFCSCIVFLILLSCFICVPLQLPEHFWNNYFEFFVGQLMRPHFFGESSWKFAMFFWWSHDSLMLCDP